MADVLPFVRRGADFVNYAGFILSRLRLLAMSQPSDPNKLTIDAHQSLRDVHQARVRFVGDETEYRLILAPADAPVEIDGTPADDFFHYPLGRR